MGIRMKNILFAFMGILLAFFLFFVVFNDFDFNILKTKDKQKTLEKKPSQDTIPPQKSSQERQKVTTVSFKENTKESTIKNTIVEKPTEPTDDDIHTHNDPETIYKKELQDTNIKVIKTKISKPFVLDMSNAQEVKMKIKAKEKDGIVKVRISISHEMLTYAQAKKKGIEVNFITHITGLIGKRVVYDASTSQFLSKNPLLKFSFIGKKGKVLTIIYQDLKGETFYNSKKIR